MNNNKTITVAVLHEVLHIPGVGNLEKKIGPGVDQGLGPKAAKLAIEGQFLSITIGKITAFTPLTNVALLLAVENEKNSKA